MSLYVLCYPRFSSVNNRDVEEFRRRHEPHRAQFVRAHFTLVFGTTAVGETELVAQVRRTANAFTPFTVKLEFVSKTWDSISGEYKLYLTPSDGEDELTKLYEHLHTDALKNDLRPDILFRPHITIATSRIEDKIDAAQKKSTEPPYPFTVTVDSMAIAELQVGALQEVASVAFA